MLSKLITPNSVAIVGASASPEKIGYQILANLSNNHFAGKIYPVNPKGGEILGHHVNTSIQEIGLAVDLVIICIPSPNVLSVLRECAENGAKSVIVISAGFSEVGEEGEKIQQEMVSLCEEAGITLLGPNCLGLINTDLQLNATFANGMPATGNVSFISQSGAMVSALIDWSRNSGVGFSKIFSLGNKAMLGEAEMLDYLYNDKSTEVIISYFENLTVSPKLTDIFLKYAKIKPTVVLFGGKSVAGARAAASHTGSMVSSYLAVETYLKQAGVMIADTFEDLFTYSALFSKYRMIKGNRIAIITNAGGPSIAACDSMIEHDLKLASIDQTTQDKLRAVLRPEASLGNPIDVLGDGTDLEYKDAIEIIKNDGAVDGVLVLLTPQSSTKVLDTARMIADQQGDKPVISAFVGGASVVEARKIIENSDKVCFEYPETGVRALKALYNFSTLALEIDQAVNGTENFAADRKDALLRKFSLPVLEYVQVNSESEVISAGDKIGYPLVLKTAKEDITHKSDTGGVRLNLQNQDELLSAFRDIGVPAIIGKMVRGKHEVFLGIKKDPNIGTVIAFGTGGIYSGAYRDLSYRIAPISKEVAKEMILETKMGEILAGARGQKSYDLDKFTEIIVNTARFADNFRNISELDFNPIIVDDNDFYLVDARIIEIN